MFVQRGWGVTAEKIDEVLRQHGCLAFHNKKYFLFVLYECFAYMPVYILSVYLVPMEAKRECWMLWKQT